MLDIHYEENEYQNLWFTVKVNGLQYWYWYSWVSLQMAKMISIIVLCYNLNLDINVFTEYSKTSIHIQPILTILQQTHWRVWCTDPMDHVSDKTSSMWSLLVVTILGLFGVGSKSLYKLQHHGLFVATHFMWKYVQNRHTMEKACKKLSTYIHTMYIPQSLTIKSAC
jgi:hypothetical protein